MADTGIETISAGVGASPDTEAAGAFGPQKVAPAAGADVALNASTASTPSLSNVPEIACPATEVPVAVQLPNGRFRGQLHEYFPDRGFGFTACFGLPVEVFVHGRSFFFTPPRDLGPGAEIEFDLDCRHGRPRALNVLLLAGKTGTTCSTAPRDTEVPCRDAAAPHRDAVAAHRDAVAPHRDAVAPRRDAVAPHHDSFPPPRSAITQPEAFPTQPEGTLARGRLRSFKPEGYGFVACDGIGDVHVAARAFIGIMPGRGTYGEDGPEVAFDLVQDECTGRMRATNAQLVVEPKLLVESDTMEVATADIPTDVLAEELLKRLSNSEAKVREYFVSLTHRSSHEPSAKT